MPEVSILSVLRERAGLTPDDLAFTFTDYDRNWDGAAENLTWSQLYRRTLNVANEVAKHGSPGDRALIVAPQGLDFVVAFLGAMQAGFVAVPPTAVFDYPTIRELASTWCPSSPRPRRPPIPAHTPPATLLPAIRQLTEPPSTRSQSVCNEVTDGYSQFRYWWVT